MEDIALEVEALSLFDPNFIAPSNEISPWHCQKACQEQPNCHFFSFNIEGKMFISKPNGTIISLDVNIFLRQSQLLAILPQKTVIIISRKVAGFPGQ